MGPKSWWTAWMNDKERKVEVMESFEKQTFRNRCLIFSRQGELIRLSIPVEKAERKQLTRDVKISYQTKWQHQHWMALRSSYERTPYFLYYEDYIRPMYEKQITYLIDWNEELIEILSGLLVNNPNQKLQLTPTTDWQQETWTDSHPWQTEVSIVDSLFWKGPEWCLEFRV